MNTYPTQTHGEHLASSNTAIPYHRDSSAHTKYRLQDEGSNEYKNLWENREPEDMLIASDAEGEGFPQEHSCQLDPESCGLTDLGHMIACAKIPVKTGNSLLGIHVKENFSPHPPKTPIVAGIQHLFQESG